MAGINDTAERWIPIDGWGGSYAVSDLGRVKRIGRNARGGTTVGRVMTTVADRNGYLRIKLSFNDASARVNLQRLVAHAFIGPCPEGFEVNHVDGDKANNTPANLEYVSRVENIRHGWRTGLFSSARNGNSMHPESRARGERSGKAVATADEVVVIRAMRTAGGTHREIAHRFGMSESGIRSICTRRTWGHVP